VTGLGFRPGAKPAAPSPEAPRRPGEGAAGTATGGAAAVRVRVLVCDDSVAIRGAIGRILRADPGIEVAATAANGMEAVAAVKRGGIDVAVLDIEMPVLDGISALPKLLEADPQLKVVMASTLTTRGADVTLKAMRAGAADYIAKPSTAQDSDETFRRELVAKVKGLARLRRGVAAPAGPKKPPPVLRPFPAMAARVLAVGSSTGGPQALFALFQGLGRDLGVPVVLTQHMPPNFLPLLAEHITRLGGMPCKLAAPGAPLVPNEVMLAAGDRHLVFETAGGGLVAQLSDGPPENFCRPAVDPMLRSLATANVRTLGVMLTGMGSDGLAGTRAIVAAGGASIVQDEASSVVWGMPGSVAQAGLASACLPLSEIAAKVRTILGGPRR